MTARIFDGNALGQRIRANVAAEIAGMLASGQPRPGLGVLLVGEDPGSMLYVSLKTRAAEEAGLHSVQINLPGDVAQQDVLDAVHDLNQDSAVHAILVQIPLPSHIDQAAVIEAIDPRKDVDGLHPYNVAALAGGRPRVIPCTPAGIMEILREEEVELVGAEAVVVGRSILVGRPIAALLLLADGTVTVCHSKTSRLDEVTRRADVLVVAAGKPGLITGEMVKPGATVIDVGTTPIPSSSTGGRRRVVGDCDRTSVEQVAGLLTPVPGGVGPLTIAMLLSNTLRAARTAQPATI
jgi:methylenetetrahydrofolate dehydrogenase (NADP+)/methenyltetrahydrofolate cyclohydrolase